MARTIRGINVKIGAETSGLKKALKNVEKESRDIGRELRKVNRGLKFSPQSTELLSQKQDLLRKRISKTSDKLSTLRKSQKQVERQFERGEIDDGQYRAFKREIVQTESKMETFNRQLKQTNRQARRAKLGLDKLKKAGRMLATGFAAASAAIASAGYVIGREINKTMEYADEVDKLSQKMGLAAETTQEWTFVAEQNGTNIESLTRALGRFQKNVGDADDGLTTATRSFKQLGVEIKDSTGQLKDMDDIFPETIRKLSEMEDETKRNQIAMNLFGRGGKELIPILNNTSGEIEDLIEQANDLDLVMSDEEIDSWVDFKDTTHALSEEFNAFRRDLATEFLPFLKQDLIPYIRDTALPTLKGFIDNIKEFFDMPFSWEGGDEIFGQISSIESVEEAEKMLEKWRAIYAENREILDKYTSGELEGEGFLGGLSREQIKMIQEANDKAKQADDIIAALENKIERLRSKSEETDTGGEDTGGGEEGPTELEKFLSDLDQQIEDYNFEEKLSGIGTTWQKEIEKLRREGKKKLIKAKDLGASEETLEKIRDFYDRQVGNVISNAKDESLELEKQYQNELALLRKEGMEKELEQLEQQKQRELEQAEGKAEAKDEIREKYAILEQQIIDKYDQKEKEAAEKLQNELALIRTKGKEKELEQLEQWYAEEQEKAEGNEEALTALKKLYDEKKLDIEEEYAEKEQKLQDEIMENKFVLNQISLQEYKEYLQERLKDYKEYTDEYAKLQEKIDNLEVTPVEVESEYTEQLEILKQKNEAFGDSFDFIAEKTKLVKDTLNRLIETGNKDSKIFTDLNILYNNLSGDGKAESLNWMTDAFVDLGVEIEEANKAFKDWEKEMVNGLSNAIARGEDLGDVFENIADQISAMVIKQAIVQPMTDAVLDWAGLGFAHEGAYVSPRGLIQDLPSYHSGGLPGLESDETIIKAQTGERVLSRSQNEALLNGELGGNTNVTLIQAVDSKSFQQMLAENKATVTQLSAEDIMKNGQLRKALKQYL